MEKKTYFSLLLFVFCVTLHAQNYIYIGKKKYEATNKWEFEGSQSLLQNPNLIVAKDTVAKRGYLMLSV